MKFFFYSTAGESASIKFLINANNWKLNTKKLCAIELLLNHYWFNHYNLNNYAVTELITSLIDAFHHVSLIMLMLYVLIISDSSPKSVNASSTWTANGEERAASKGRLYTLSSSVSVQLQFSWFSAPTNYCFALDAVHQAFPGKTTDAEINSIIRNRLRNAPKRKN